MPGLRTINASMEVTDSIFCNTTEKLLYMCMKKVLPQSCKGKEEKLYIVPPQVKMLLPNSTSFIHASRNALTDESDMLNTHVDLQNPVEICNIPDSFMKCIVGCFSQ